MYTLMGLQFNGYISSRIQKIIRKSRLLASLVANERFLLVEVFHPAVSCCSVDNLPSTDVAVIYCRDTYIPHVAFIMPSEIATIS